MSGAERTHALEAWRAYFETSQLITAQLDASLREHSGLDLGDYNILLVLAEAPQHTLRMSVLARCVVFSVPRLSHRIGVLVGRGWVSKVPCPDDRRASNIVLTDPGREVFAQAARRHREDVRAVFDDVLSDEQVSALASAMIAMREAVVG